MTHLLLAAASLAAVMTSQDTTLRVNVTLVQVDAIVKDRAGKQVRNLTRDDFEILEGGKPRTPQSACSIGTRHFHTY